MSKSEFEALKLQELNLFQLVRMLREGIIAFEDLSDIFKKAHFTQHVGTTLEIEKAAMPPYIQQLYEISPEQLVGTEYFNRIKPGDIERLVPQFINFFADNDAARISSGFQGLAKKKQTRDGFVYMMTSVKRSGDQLLAMHSPIEQLGDIAPKIQRALELDTFMRKNYEKFQLLSKTEKAILQLLALGYTNPEIAEKRFISVLTVATHRKSINRKLEVKNYRELLRFAQAFDLI